MSVLYLVALPGVSFSQSENLFKENLNLSIQLSFDFKELYRDTNDSTFIKSKMVFSGNEIEEDTITARIRVREETSEKRFVISSR